MCPCLSIFLMESDNSHVRTVLGFHRATVEPDKGGDFEGYLVPKLRDYESIRPYLEIPL